MVSPGGSDSKESACRVGDRFSPLARKIPWRREWLASPVFLLGNPMDRGAWRATVHQSDTTERLTLLTVKSKFRVNFLNLQRKNFYFSFPPPPLSSQKWVPSLKPVCLAVGRGKHMGIISHLDQGGEKWKT